MTVLLKAQKRIGTFLIGVGILVIMVSQFMVISRGLDQYEWIINLLLNLGSGTVGAALVILVVERNLLQLQGKVEDERELERLVASLGSRVTPVAVHAAEVLSQRAWWEDGSLSKINLSNASLQKANFRDVNLANALLNWSDLREADFTQANLQGTDLGGSQCQKLDDSSPRAATFWYANLERAAFGSAVLTGVNFGGAILIGVDFTGAALIDASFTDETRFDETTTLPDGKAWSSKTDLTEFTKRKPLTVRIERYA